MYLKPTEQFLNHVKFPMKKFKPFVCKDRTACQHLAKWSLLPKRVFLILVNRLRISWNQNSDISFQSLQPCKTFSQLKVLFLWHSIGKSWSSCFEMRGQFVDFYQTFDTSHKERVIPNHDTDGYSSKSSVLLLKQALQDVQDKSECNGSLISPIYWI